MSSNLVVSSDGAVRLLTLNRPARLNALDFGLRQALIEQMEAAAEDPEVRVVLLAGAGPRAFCAGQDLNESQALESADEGDWIGSWRRFFLAFLKHPKPILVAINGVAAGGGLEIAMFADIRLATPSARLIMAEINIGLPTLIGSYFLTAHLFQSRMADIVLSGRTIGGEEAREIGLVHHLVEPARLAERSMAVAQELADKPPFAMAQNIKRFRELRLGLMQRDGVFEALSRYQTMAVESGEPQQVMAAFLAERARRRSANTDSN